MAVQPSASNPKKIVVIGGGIIGCSTAYYVTRHSWYNPKIHSIVILEATKIAGGSSGKGGGFIADWATPRSLALLSFKLHDELAKEHGGDKTWGYRNVYAAEIKLWGRNLPDHNPGGPSDSNSEFPLALDWLLPGSVRRYDEIGTPSNSGQVNPLKFTTALAKLAEEKGAEIVFGSATQINYKKEEDAVASVTYTHNGRTDTIEATDIVVAAGPWTPKLLPKVHLLTPRGHSVIVRPTRPLSPYILFPNIEPAPNSDFNKLISPDIYPRPEDELHEFDTVYSSGPDGYEVPLPADTESVEIDEQKCEEVLIAMGSVSQEIHDGTLITKQACYKPQIRKHEETEEVGPMVGPMGTKGLWLATGHDEWGIQNAPATGLVMSEMIFEGKSRSADCEGLDPRQFLRNPSSL